MDLDSTDARDDRRHLPEEQFVSRASNEQHYGPPIKCHPLVLLNISDHWTRQTVLHNKAGSSQLVLGALFGTQKGREVEIHNSFEILLTPDEGMEPIVDRDFLTAKTEKFNVVFPAYEMIGWYTIGSTLDSRIHRIHQQLFNLRESAILALYNPLSNSQGDFPLTLFLSQIGTANVEDIVQFQLANYQIETGDAERVAVDHVIKSATEASGSQLKVVSHLLNQKAAIIMLREKMELLHAYLVDMDEGKVPLDHDIQRQLSSICGRLPLVEDPRFQNELFAMEKNDVALITYLTSLAQGMNSLNELVENCNSSGPQKLIRGNRRV